MVLFAICFVIEICKFSYLILISQFAISRLEVASCVIQSSHLKGLNLVKPCKPTNILLTSKLISTNLAASQYPKLKINFFPCKNLLINGTWIQKWLGAGYGEL